MAKQLDMPDGSIVKFNGGAIEDFFQRPIKRIVDYTVTEKDRTEVVKLEFTIEDYPDIAYLKKGIFVVFSSLDGTVQSMFDGWCNLQLVDINNVVSANLGLFTGNTSCVIATYCGTIRNGVLHGRQSNNTSMTSLTANVNSNTAYGEYLIPILDWFEVNAPKNGGGLKERPKLDINNLQKINLYGYKTTTFSNVGRIEIYGF